MNFTSIKKIHGYPRNHICCLLLNFVEGKGEIILWMASNWGYVRKNGSIMWRELSTSAAHASIAVLCLCPGWGCPPHTPILLASLNIAFLYIMNPHQKFLIRKMKYWFSFPVIFQQVYLDRMYMPQSLPV